MTAWDGCYTTCPFEQQDVASLHQSTGDSMGTPICVRTSLSPWCHLHVHDCFAKLWKVSSIWFFPTQCVRRLVLCGRSVGLRKLSLGDTPDTHGAMFSPFSELLRSLARQFYSAAILQRHSSKIVFFYSALSQWCRGNIALITALPVQDCLNLDSICSPGIGRKVSSLFNKTNKNRQNTSRFGSASPNFGSPNCGQMTYSQSQTKKTKTPTRHPWKAPLTFRFHLRPAPSSVRLSASATAAGRLCKWIAQRSHLTWD